MSAALPALMKAFGQLGDRAVVAVLVKSVAVTLVVFAGAGAALYAALPLVSDSAWFAALIPPGIGGPLLIVVWLLVVAVAFWLLFRVVALAVLQFIADEVVAAVEAKHYPVLARRARPLPLGREVTRALRGLLRVVGYTLLALPFAAVLLFTAIGPGLVFLAVNAVLLGREFTDMAWVRHCGAGGERANPVPRSDRVVLGAAAGTHLVLRRMAAEEAAA